MDTVDGKVAVVTGAASGIGRAAAHAFSRCGARVVLADIDGAGAEHAAQEIRSRGGTAVGASCDVSKKSAFEDLRRTTVDTYGGVDIVMNNAGVLTRGLPEHIPVEEWQRVLDTNLLSMVRSNAAFLPVLLERQAGHVVNTASFAGLFTYSHDRLPYSVSKAGVVQLSEGLALYLRPQGVGVTVLCPGPVRTAIADSIRSFGPETATCGPGAEFAPLDPATVGEQVLDAVLTDRFMLQTDGQVRDHLIRRAQDWDGYLADRLRTWQAEIGTGRIGFEKLPDAIDPGRSRR